MGGSLLPQLWSFFDVLTFFPVTVTLLKSITVVLGHKNSHVTLLIFSNISVTVMLFLLHN